MIITTNADTKQRLELASKDAHVVILSAEQSVDDDQYFSHVGYLKLLVRRTQILNLLIQHDFETFLFEFDFLWIKNPVPLLHSYNDQYDMLFIGIIMNLTVSMRDLYICFLQILQDKCYTN